MPATVPQDSQALVWSILGLVMLTLVGIAGWAVRAVLRGRLVPESTHKAMTEDRNNWRTLTLDTLGVLRQTVEALSDQVGTIADGQQTTAKYIQAVATVAEERRTS